MRVRFRFGRVLVYVYAAILIVLGFLLGWMLARQNVATTQKQKVAMSPVLLEVGRPSSEVGDHPSKCYDCEKQYADQRDAWQGQKTKCFSCEQSPHLETPFDAHPIRYYETAIA